jgi:hypothetical protein
VPWREFAWRSGVADGELEEEDLHLPPKFCGGDPHLRRHPREDDDGDIDQKKPRAHNIIGRLSHWIDNRSRSRGRHPERDRGNDWYRGESSRRGMRSRDLASPPPSRGSPSLEENRAMRMLWQNKGQMEPQQSSPTKTMEAIEHSDAIWIIPQEDSQLALETRDVICSEAKRFHNQQSLERLPASYNPPGTVFESGSYCKMNSFFKKQTMLGM